MPSDENALEKPDWIEDPETGQLLPIQRGIEYARALQKFYEAECTHPSTEVLRVRVAGGSVQVRNCCTVCGDRRGTSLSQKDKAWVESLPWQSSGRAGTYKSRRDEEKRAILIDLARRQFAENGRFTASYQAYIQSPGWKARREKVMKRCRGMCEGCGDNRAVHVHHHSYRHFGNEFLFELLGLCQNCHDRLHKEEIGEGDEEQAA